MTVFDCSQFHRASVTLSLNRFSALNLEIKASTFMNLNLDSGSSKSGLPNSSVQMRILSWLSALSMTLNPFHQISEAGQYHFGLRNEQSLRSANRQQSGRFSELRRNRSGNFWRDLRKRGK
jgi:hypothetical protein